MTTPAFDWSRCGLGVHAFTLSPNGAFVIDEPGYGFWVNRQDRTPVAPSENGAVWAFLDDCSTPIYVAALGSYYLPFFNRLRFLNHLAAASFFMNVVVFTEPGGFALPGWI